MYKRQLYILASKKKLGRQAKQILYAYLRKSWADEICSIASLSYRTFSNFLSGQCLEAVILGTMFFVVLLIEMCIRDRLGADVPFCVLVQNTGFGCALCRGIGEELSPIKNKIKKAVLLVKPSFGVSTKEVYSAIDHCRILSRPDNQAIINALKQGDQQALYKNMANVLEDYTLLQYGDVKELKIKLMSETMAEAVMMTGSGPTVFAPVSYTHL